jgi:hypothetical protein
MRTVLFRFVALSVAMIAGVASVSADSGIATKVTNDLPAWVRP